MQLSSTCDGLGEGKRRGRRMAMSVETTEPSSVFFVFTVNSTRKVGWVDGLLFKF